MKETTLLKVALICSLAGLSILFFISTKIDFKDYKPSMPLENIGDDVKLAGVVSKISQMENVAFIEIDYEFPITIVLFSDKNVTLQNGEKIEVFGEVQEYKGKNEIIADKIRILK